ncbi:MAG: hypothetical protein D6776_07440 [Planctomycetota bacterium]|nr:MAG: hypothetical protein D6776_07440 [Planctomycetota bacterium]
MSVNGPGAIGRPIEDGTTDVAAESGRVGGGEQPATGADASAPTRGTSPVRFSVQPSASGLGIVSRLRLEPDAVSYVEGALAVVPSRVAGTLRRLLREAAALDANRVLTLREAETVIEPALDALPGGGAALRARLREVDAWLDRERAREAAVRDGIDVVFNSDPEAPSLSATVIEQLDAAVREAAGRPLDIHIMIFSFTDEAIADKLLEIAETNPNAHIRILTDFSQTTQANGYRPAWLVEQAQARGLDNLEVRFKKDQPYRWDAAAKRLRWDHGVTRGLNHHKGLVTLVDGQPRRMVAGSFNWSPSADRKNYENLMTFDATVAANRLVMRHYEAEFEALWNDGRASLTLEEAREHKRRIEAEFRADPSKRPSEVVGLEAGAGASLSRLAPDDILDLNDPSAGQRIAAWFGGGERGREIAMAIAAERLRFGRFEDADDLLARVPTAAQALGADGIDRLREQVVFGDGKLSVNLASREELIAAGATRAAADAIVTWREAHGEFESLEQVRALPEISRSTWYRMRRFLTADLRRVAFSARRPDEPQGDAGFARVNEERMVPVRQPDGSVVYESATIGAGAVDMIRRAKPGETLKLATYGLSVSTPEFAALVEAARSGVRLRVILNRKYNEAVADRLRSLAADEGLDIEVKTSGRTMHQKYLVHVEGEDAFNGSANLSSNAERKHAEDRFFIKNNAAVARAFEADFDRLWERLPG